MSLLPRWGRLVYVVGNINRKVLLVNEFLSNVQILPDHSYIPRLVINLHLFLHYLRGYRFAYLLKHKFSLNNLNVFIEFVRVLLITSRYINVYRQLDLFREYLSA